MPQLTPRAKKVLDIESVWGRYPNGKAEAALSELGMSLPRFHVVLNEVIGTEAALAYNPALVKVLLARRDQRARSRSARAS